VPTFGSGGLMVEAEAWEKDLQGWNERLKTSCGVSVPMTASRPDNAAQDPQSARKSLFEDFPTKTVLLASAAVLIVAGGVALFAAKNSPVVRILRGVLKG
jgi:hypothetical protein